MADSLTDRVMFMSGGSRGIGLAIATRAARDGVKVALMAKTAEPHPKLPGTVYTAAEEIEAIDMGRRGLHDEGSHLLMDRLKGKIAVDIATARRLFTLLCALHWKG